MSPITQKFKLISCNVFTREICHCVAASPHTIDLEFLPKDAHERPTELRRLIQEKIDACENAAVPINAILLGYGLCGNAAAGLLARSVPLVLPRAHDCCTLFLGSKKSFEKLFADQPSMPFSSAGYMERDGAYLHSATEFTQSMGYQKSYEDYAALYGEANAKFIWENLHPDHKDTAKNQTVIYIDNAVSRGLPYEAACRALTQKDGKEFRKVEGSMRLFEALLCGNWDEGDFLIVPPGRETAGEYGFEEIIKIRPPQG